MKRIVTYLTIFAFAFLWVACATKMQTSPALPCSIDEDTDSLYIREVGHGVSANLQQARRESLSEAKMRILSHFLNVTSKDSLPLLQTDILHFEKECENVFVTDNQYHVYTRLASPIPDEARLLYYREQFRKYAEEKQKQMLDNRTNNADDSVMKAIPSISGPNGSDSTNLHQIKNNQ